MQDKQKYEEALEVVKKFEKRQADLEMLNKELGFLLNKEFVQFKFDMNKKKEAIRFAGVLNSGELVMSESNTRSPDVFEPVIGKLICVHKALNKDFTFLEEHIERKYSDFCIGASDDEFRLTNKSWLGKRYEPIQADTIYVPDFNLTTFKND